MTFNEYLLTPQGSLLLVSPDSGKSYDLLLSVWDAALIHGGIPTPKPQEDTKKIQGNAKKPKVLSKEIDLKKSYDKATKFLDQ